MTHPERPFLSVASDSNALREALEVALEMRDPAADIPIGLIGCGWIGGLQLQAYAAHEFNVVALFDREPERASRYKDRFFPQAEVHQSLDSLIAHPGLKVVDVATHLGGRPETILRCLTGGLNVLSQKPFASDLAVGEALSRAARTRNVAIAVNQNGRWAPHFAVMLAAVRAGIIGDVVSADFSVAWPHDLVVESKPAFADMNDLVLFDFGAHWFDLVGVLAPLGTLVVHAVTLARPGQTIAAPLQASVIISGQGSSPRWTSVLANDSRRPGNTGSAELVASSRTLANPLAAALYRCTPATRQRRCRCPRAGSFTGLLARWGSCS